MTDNLDYIMVLKALKEIPFGVGKKLLIEFLQGKETHKSIQKNKLYDLDNFGSLAYDTEELSNLIDNLLLNSLIELTSIPGNKFWKVLELSQKGEKEIENPQLYTKKLSFNFKETKTTITRTDQEQFMAFGDFLSKYNDSQKKSIIDNNKHILCIAGAGSGKTTVLTKRIDFLVNYRSVDPNKILAITFTRKARQEMMDRLSKFNNTQDVMVETFNSFCEKILRQYNDIIYGKPVNVLSYRDKHIVIRKALSKLNLNMNQAINTYFTYAQQRSKTSDQLANIFLNDCFFVRDYFKFKNKRIEESSFQTDDKTNKKSAELMFGVCNYIESFMNKNGLRDFADQLIDAIKFLEQHPDKIPKFDHILIDEYQDVNSTQIKLVDLLNPENIFCVGDPRQSIYGWRGSDIKYVLNFEDKYPGCNIITLTKNYRSTKPIVNLINRSITNMGLADLESSVDGDKEIQLIKFISEGAEFEFVIQAILESKLPRKEIFVLARTNRQLNDLSQLMKHRGIRHLVRGDEMKKSVVVKETDVTLATVHGIKGLEAELVFVIGCTANSFPCKGSEHPVIEMIKIDEYDKEEEERRLFYVAMSRARSRLYLTYSGKKPTYFITDDMLKLIDSDEVKPTPEYKLNKAQSGDMIARLRSWRTELSQNHNVSAFMIMHDRTMIEIAQKMPMTLDELGQVHGMGPTKVMKYGDEILQIIHG